jgi:hypothetical protein
MASVQSAGRSVEAASSTRERMLSVSKASRQCERDFDPAGSRPIGTTRTHLEDGGSRTSASWEWPRAWLVEQTAQSYLAWGAAVRGGDLADHRISRRLLKLTGKINKRIEHAQPTAGG